MPDFSFDTEADLSFRVDAAKRTISGLVVPFGSVARSGGRDWKFTPGSLHWSSESRVKLNASHDRSVSFGKAVRLQEVPAGLDASFQVARGPVGDQALIDAEDGVRDGFSIEIDFEDGDSYHADPTNPSVNIVDRATLRHVALTASPAFDDARVASVAATREATPMTATASEPTTEVAAAPTATFTADQLAEAFVTAMSQLPEPQGRQIIPAGSGIQVSYEPPVYSLVQSLGAPSFVRDAWKARTEHDQDAIARLQRFTKQQADISGRVNAAGLQFATGTTTTAAAIIPPGYRPELYVPQLFQGRPLTESVSQGAISDATPFTVPKFVSASGMAANHTEGTNATDGTLTFGTITVTPTAVDGLFKVTREIVDSSNPALDAIALQAMREAYSQNTEAKVYAELNGANGVGGTVTTGFVPSGAAAQAITGAAGSIANPGLAGGLLLDTIRGQLAAYPFRRFAAVNRMVLAAEGTSALALGKDGNGRPLLPPLAPQNAAGGVHGLGTPVQGFNVDGLAGLPAWSMTGNAAGDADVILFNSADVWAWESPTMTFRYEERSGPALIELALFGYFATKILRPSGFTGIRLTLSA
jgi:HK97 family phage major capsid protein/HK97 family phage prohead protease